MCPYMVIMEQGGGEGRGAVDLPFAGLIQILKQRLHFPFLQQSPSTHKPRHRIPCYGRRVERPQDGGGCW